MTNFEAKLRELADKATPGPWVHDYVQGESCVLTGHALAVAVPYRPGNSANCEHIAFNDPETAKLVADVLAAAREVDDSGSLTHLGCGNRLSFALAVLDAHHSRRSSPDGDTSQENP